MTLSMHTKADVECELFKAIPKGFEEAYKSKDYVLMLKRNLVGQIQHSQFWNIHLLDNDKQTRLVQSEIVE